MERKKEEKKDGKIRKTKIKVYMEKKKDYKYKAQ